MADQAAISGVLGALGGMEAPVPIRPSPATVSANEAGALRQPGFAEVLAQVSLDTAQALRTAEATSIEGLRGRASTLEVVEAVKQAEQALSTAVALRDRAIEAYQEISRMAI